MLVMALVFAVVPAAAASAQSGSQVTEVEEEILDLDTVANELGGADAAEWSAGLVEVETALADAKAVAPDLDYTDVDAAIVDLKAAIDGGDVTEMAAAGALLATATGNLSSTRLTELQVALLFALIDELGGADVDDWSAGLVEVEAALADAKAAAPDLDYADLDAAIIDLKAAIEGGDIGEIEAAGVAVVSASAGVVAQADAAAAAATQTSDGTPAPTIVATGDAVPTSGPSVALLVFAGVLVMLAVGALAMRRPTKT
jgi:hypothetical protein